MGLGAAVRVNDAPDDLATSAMTVEVVERVGHPTSYRLTYAIDADNGDFPLLKEGKLGPGSQMSVLVQAGDKTHCLVRGPVYGQQIQMKQAGANSVLTVLGADSLIKMDREDKAVAWADLTDSAVVESIVGQAGMTPDVDATQSGHYEAKHTLIQRETDLAFVRRLARRNGSLFWATADEHGVETAHFKRPSLGGQADCELVINLTDPRSNLTAIDIAWDVERPTGTSAAEVDVTNKSDIDGSVQRSPLTALGGSALADIVPDSRLAHIHAPVDDGSDLRARSEGALIDASFFVRASGSTTVSAVSKVIRAHTLVNLRGLGSRHSGLWFCSAVRHSIDASEHRMDFELIRNGWKG